MSLRRRTRKRILIAAVAVLAVAGFVAVGEIPHAPDVTRERVEHDMAQNFANQFLLAHEILGRPLDAPITATDTCDKGGPDVPDRGPGRNWVCYMRYVDPASGRRIRRRYELQVRGEACYIAIDPRLIEQPSLVDAATGATVPNPLAQFDGCFEVYDGLTRTTA